MSRALILTRPAAQSADFAAALARRLPGRFAPVVVAPLLAIAPAGGPVELAGVGGLLFTSANGVEAFAAASPERRLPALCVGAMTAAAARDAGFEALSADGDVDALASLAACWWRPGGGDLLHVRGRHAAGDLLGALSARGVPARAAELYEQVTLPLPPEAQGIIARGDPVVVPLFSPRTARAFAQAVAGLDLGAVTVVGLSAAVAAAVPVAGRRVVAPGPGREGMLAALDALDQP
ncbi:MAG: uroporphyrinogen-III synthase [Amaricoccus sp.]|uniref:uroporphyrinogen-III synthase n=1 Tax=Amaricoccus sp. TaxID=1872485 RepID=UPI0039E293E9